MVGVCFMLSWFSVALHLRRDNVLTPLLVGIQFDANSEDLKICGSAASLTSEGVWRFSISARTRFGTSNRMVPVDDRASRRSTRHHVRCRAGREHWRQW